MWFLIGVMAILTIAYIIPSLKSYAEAAELTRQADFTKWTVHIDAYTLNHDDIDTMPEWGGDFVKISDSSGREGWVPYYNIQELKLRSYN